jgi:hypothetical protein
MSEPKCSWFHHDRSRSFERFHQDDQLELLRSMRATGVVSGCEPGDGVTALRHPLGEPARDQ